jgi:hypothetical protein
MCLSLTALPPPRAQWQMGCLLAYLYQSIFICWTLFLLGSVCSPRKMATPSDLGSPPLRPWHPAHSTPGPQIGCPVGDSCGLCAHDRAYKTRSNGIQAELGNSDDEDERNCKHWQDVDDGIDETELLEAMGSQNDRLVRTMQHTIFAEKQVAVGPSPQPEGLKQEPPPTWLPRRAIPIPQTTQTHASSAIYQLSATSSATPSCSTTGAAIGGYSTGGGDARDHQYRCTFPGCNSAPFQTQYLLNFHASVHATARPHYCPVANCPRGEGGKGFKRKNEMIRHGLIHDSPGYICPFCPDRGHFKYPRPDNLQRYDTSHSAMSNVADLQIGM